MAHILFVLLFVGLPARALESNWAVAEKKLSAAGHFAPEFIAALHAASNNDNFDEILELNTLLFLKHADYHGVQVTSEAAVAVEEFAKVNAEYLKKAQTNYAVSPRVIVSLLWMESRHGKNQGRFLLANVFTDLLQDDQPSSLKYLTAATKKFTAKKLTRHERRGIVSRAHKRVKWAIAELRALEKMWSADHDILNSLKGSFAGAIGMPQFEPSSFAAYARAYNISTKTPDLTSAPDAIQSVAFYLNKNGWRFSKRSQMRALLRYNKSHDYARAILKLAAISLGQNSRIPAGK